jgi:hypothetical protein
MKRSRFTKLLGAIALPAMLFTIGCNQSPAPSEVPDTGKHVNGDPLGAVDGGFKDISKEESEKTSPLIPAGEGPARKVDISTLTALHYSMVQNGQINMAKKLRNSYDFQTGEYKGDAAAFKSAVLSKSGDHWWNTSFISHRAAAKVGTSVQWLAYQGNNVWSGSDNGPKIQGLEIKTNAEIGYTPYLRWTVRWNNGAGWTQWRGWNDYGAHNSYYLQSIRVKTEPPYAGATQICYEVAYKVMEGPEIGTTGTKLGCNDQPASGPIPAAAGDYGQPYLSEFSKIRFNLMSFGTTN